MGAVATFDYGAWIARYPEFTPVWESLANDYFAEATLYHANDGTGPVRDVGQQLLLLNMLTAHIAQLNKTCDDDDGSAQLVGRITNASEGSVSVAVENDYPPGTAQWYQQTRYGSAYWAATAGYRTAHYVPGFRRPRRGFGAW
jgi:hypothetical protein